jgi:hypothetical protein
MPAQGVITKFLVVIARPIHASTFAKIKSLLHWIAELNSLCSGESDGSRAGCYFAAAGLEKRR